MFTTYSFILAKHHRKDASLINVISSNGGKVVPKFVSRLNPATTLLIHSYKIDPDDDNILDIANLHNIVIVPPSYIHWLTERSKLFPTINHSSENLLEFALGFAPDFNETKALGKSFSKLNILDLTTTYIHIPPTQTSEIAQSNSDYLTLLQTHGFSQTPNQKYIYITTLGFNTDTNPSDQTNTLQLHQFTKFLTAYFGLETKFLPTEISYYFDSDVTDLSYGYFNLRIDDTIFPIHTQKLFQKLTLPDQPLRLHAVDIIDVLKEYIPDDALFVLVITFDDIYEVDDDEDEVNIIMGRATGERVCVVSQFRFHPYIDEILEKQQTVPARKSKKQKQHYTFKSSYSIFTDWYSESKKRLGPEESEKMRKLMLRLFSGTAAHELLHLYGIDHCYYFKSCVMGATIEGVEGSIADEPLLPCPVEYRKLSNWSEFDSIEKIVGRIRAVEEFCRQNGFDSDVEDIKKKLKHYKEMQ